MAVISANGTQADAQVRGDEIALTVEGLAVQYAIHDKWKTAVADATFSIRRGKTLAIVGESGCGKSATCLAMMRLLPTNGRTTGGRVVLGQTDLLQLSERKMRMVRGHRIGMVFQDALTALDPLFTVGDQIVETLRVQRRMSPQAARTRAAELLELVGISEPGRRLHQHPHTLSGGMRQRVMIALALAGEPEVLIADEPTSALDVTTQRQILDLLKDLQARLGMAVIIVAHDLAVVADMADDVAVMYAGRVVERGPKTSTLGAPKHPYTERLLASVIDTRTPPKAPLPMIPGTVPDVGAEWRGCEFRSRCHLATQECEKSPPLEPVGDAQFVACFHSDRVARPH